MSDYTPGPWSVSIHPDKTCAALSIGQFGDSYVEGFATIYLNTVANSHLIAAAPELLEALEYALMLIKESPGSNEVYRLAAERKALAAIAKAKGESTP